MNKFLIASASFAVLLLLSACHQTQKGNYLYDLQMVEVYGRGYELTADHGKSRIVVSPDFQGRVMSSTATGFQGVSNGWINHAFIARDVVLDTQNPYGGEDRTLLGPMKGEHALYYPPGLEHTEANYAVPADFDQHKFNIDYVTDSSIVLTKSIALKNAAGHHFNARLSRAIEVYSKQQAVRRFKLGVDTAGVDMVGYSVTSQLKNTNTKAWSRSNGLLELWNSGKLNAPVAGTLIIPLQDSTLKHAENFTAGLDASQFWVQQGCIFVPFSDSVKVHLRIPQHALKKRAAVYCPKLNRLSLFYFGNQAGEDLSRTLDKSETEDGFVFTNLANAEGYFQVQSKAPSKALKPNEMLMHQHSVCHLFGEAEKLNAVSERVLGSGLAQ